MQKLWHYLLNQFLNVTARSYRKAVKMSNYHDAALKEAQTHEPALVPVYMRYHPLHLILVSKYNEWRSAGGVQKGETANVKQLLELSIPKLTNWDARIQAVYAKGTPRYIALFPLGHKPFVSAGIDDRIDSFDTLSLTIGADANPVMIAVKGEVDAEFTLLDGARDTQSGKKIVKKADRTFVEDARVEAMTMQHRNLGFCMDTLYDKLIMASGLFDQETLRAKQQKHFTGNVLSAETKAVMVHSFLEDDVIELEVTGTGAPASANLSFYLGTVAGAINSSPVVVMANNGKRTITADQFGITEYGTHRHLTVVSNSTVELHYTVDI